jgi:hypothetical protein
MQYVTTEYDSKGATRWTREATDAAIGTEIMRSIFDHAPVSWRRINKNEIPVDREFRDAWVDGGAAIVHNMSKARFLFMTRFRQERGLKLEQLDKDWMRWQGQRRSAEADSIEAQRQTLRDLPATVQPAVDQAQSIADLRAIPRP